jgi:flagellar biosynthetic protein FliQ
MEPDCGFAGEELLLVESGERRIATGNSPKNGVLVPEELLLTLAKQSFQTLIWVSGPMLLAGIVVGVSISVLQVVTSIQDATLAFVPRVLAIFAVFLFTLPWVVHKMVSYTTHLFSNFTVYIR